jgi:hypothetical protein
MVFVDMQPANSQVDTLFDVLACSRCRAGVLGEHAQGGRNAPLPLRTVQRRAIVDVRSASERVVVDRRRHDGRVVSDSVR